MNALKNRLAFYKSKIGQHGVTDWRQVAKASHYWSKSLARARYSVQFNVGAWGGSKRWLENTDSIGLRFVDYSDKIVRLDHHGWFTDSFCDETFRGAVWQLPSRNGSPLFVYGYNDPNNEGAAYIDFNHTDDKEQAARWGDRIAEKEAEESREYHAKDMAEQDIANAKEAIHHNNQDTILLIREIKKAGSFSPAICQALKAQLQTMLNYRANQFELIKKRERDFWSAVENF